MNSLLKNALILAIAAAMHTLPAASAATTLSSPQLESIVKAREQRVELLRSELKALDSRIEDRIDSIVDALKSITDSKDSRTIVTRLKEKTADGLTKNIEYFRQKRATLVEELRRPTMNLTPEQKRRGIEVFDEHIEKRVSQIVALQKSFPTHKDYDRYEVTGSNWYGTTYKASDDFEQNQRLTARTNQQRTKLTDGLEKSIARLESQNRALRAAGAPSAEIEKNDALIAERRKQLQSVLLPTSTPPSRTLGQKEALALDQSIQKAANELRGEFNTLFARYNAMLGELQSLNAAKAALASARR